MSWTSRVNTATLALDSHLLNAGSEQISPERQGRGFLYFYARSDFLRCWNLPACQSAVAPAIRYCRYYYSVAVATAGAYRFCYCPLPVESGSGEQLLQLLMTVVEPIFQMVLNPRFRKQQSEQSSRRFEFNGIANERLSVIDLHE